MRDIEVSKRMVAKSPEQWFLRIMQEGYNLSPKMSESLLAETELCFQGNKKTKIGQQKVILVKRKEKHGRPIKELEKEEILWTLDAGLEDEQYLCDHGKTELRQKRIQRLLQEATEQNGIATQEDLARVLHVSVRTIKRDFSVMKQAGIELVTRGYDEGVGRGQTHKSEIIQRWMNGESYDQLVRNTGHSSSSIQRYIQKYMQVVELSKQGFETDDIGRLAQIGRGLVAQYLLIYEEAKKEPAREKWIENQRKRIFYPVQRERALKKGVL